MPKGDGVWQTGDAFNVICFDERTIRRLAGVRNAMVWKGDASDNGPDTIGPYEEIDFVLQPVCKLYENSPRWPLLDLDKFMR